VRQASEHPIAQFVFDWRYSLLRAVCDVAVLALKVTQRPDDMATPLRAYAASGQPLAWAPGPSALGRSAITAGMFAAESNLDGETGGDEVALGDAWAAPLLSLGQRPA